jgi:glycosyltransferase involved in cell wall biosynthesis
MRILINTLPYYNKEQSGLHTYIRGFLQALHHTRADMEWHVLLRHEDIEACGIANDSRFHSATTSSLTQLYKIPGARFAWRHIADQTIGPLLSNNFDVVHYLDSYGPTHGLGRTSLLLTVHDILPLLNNDYHSGWVKRYLSMLMERSIPRASFILAISEATASDIERVLHIPRGQIAVVPNGIGNQFQPSPLEERQRVAQYYGLTGPYLIYVGRISPRKNVARLIHSFARARQLYHLPHQLALVGGIGWDAQDVSAAITEVDLGDTIRVLGHVPEADVPPLLSGADAMTLISLSEGFGLPVAEAMACATPVLTSNVSSLQEVANGAALLVDPTDDNAITNAIARICQDSALREKLRVAGLNNSRRYRWSSVAQAAVDIYRWLATDVNRRPAYPTFSEPDYGSY